MVNNYFSKMRMMISKWVLDKVSERNPTLSQFIGQFERLNAQSVAGRNGGEDEDIDGVVLEYEDYLLAECGENAELCDFSNECVQNQFFNIFEESNDELFLISYQENCPKLDLL